VGRTKSWPGSCKAEILACSAPMKKGQAPTGSASGKHSTKDKRRKRSQRIK